MKSMKMKQSLRVSVAALALLTGAGSCLVLATPVRADDRMAGSGPSVYSTQNRLSAAPGVVSSDPLSNAIASSDTISETVILDLPSMDDLADLAPASGTASNDDLPQILGGSDQDSTLTPEPETANEIQAEMMPPPAAPAPEPAPAPVPSPVVTEVSPSTPTPDDMLAAPAASDIPQAVSGDVVTNVIQAPSMPEGPDVYYDSREAAMPPTGPMATSVGPRKVDPIKEPASKFIISNRTHGANDQEALLVAAERALDLGRNEAALEFYEQLYSKNKRDGRILMGRAIAQQRLGLGELALLSYEELLKINPNSTEAVVNMMGLLQKQYPEIALRRLTDLRDKFPANDLILAQLGMVHATMGNMNEAIRSLTTATMLAPNNALHLYNLAVLSDKGGHKDKAVRFYQDALKTDAVYGGGKSIPRAQIYDRLSQLR